MRDPAPAGGKLYSISPHPPKKNAADYEHEPRALQIKLNAKQLIEVANGFERIEFESS